MIIRKLFKFEGSHIVRDCTSRRCSYSIHGHSYTVEVMFKSSQVDNGQMVMDFGLMKGTIRDFIDSFDHCHVMWSRERDADKEYFKQYERTIILPVSPSAEMLSLMFFFVIDRIVRNTVFTNGEGSVKLHSVRVHETETGWAESFEQDLILWDWDLEEIEISEPIKLEWRDPQMWSKLLRGERFTNPKIELKYSK